MQGEELHNDDADFWFQYLLRFPENEYFHCTNAASNPLSDELDRIQKLANKGIIEHIVVPTPDPRNIGGCGYGYFSHNRYKYNMNMEYDYAKYGIEP